MHSLELAHQRHIEVRQSAERVAFGRRVAAARRWQRRLEEATRRARLASQAVRCP